MKALKRRRRPISRAIGERRPMSTSGAVKPSDVYFGRGSNSPREHLLQLMLPFTRRELRLVEGQCDDPRADVIGDAVFQGQIGNHLLERHGLATQTLSGEPSSFMRPRVALAYSVESSSLMARCCPRSPLCPKGTQSVSVATAKAAAPGVSVTWSSRLAARSRRLSRWANHLR
jgi:hypothetical protein